MVNEVKWDQNTREMKGAAQTETDTGPPTRSLLEEQQHCLLPGVLTHPPPWSPNKELHFYTSTKPLSSWGNRGTDHNYCLDTQNGL